MCDVEQTLSSISSDVLGMMTRFGPGIPATICSTFRVMAGSKLSTVRIISCFFLLMDTFLNLGLLAILWTFHSL